ncbi:MAG: hemerythrin domain-containing protein [Planctomycetota bacterium]
MRSVEILREDHALMRRVLACLGRAVEEALAGGRIDEEVFGKALGFAKEFVHGIHQAREEILSRHARRKGLDGGGANPCNDILDFLGAALRALPDAVQGEPAARRLLAENAKAYVGLARSHIVGREGVFRGVERGLSEDDDRMLLSLFEAAERRLDGESPRHYAEVVREIEARAKATEESGHRAMSHEAS